MIPYEAFQGDHLILDADQAIGPGWVGVHNGTIVEVGEGKAPAELRARRGGPGSILAPGFVCTHTHLPLTAYRDVGHDREFLPWLLEGLIPAMSAVKNESLFYAKGARESVKALQRSGVTTIADSFLTPAGFDAMVALRARGVFFCEVFGSLAADLELYWAEQIQRLSCLPEATSLVHVGFAPHTPWTCPPAIMERVLRHGRERGKRSSLHLLESVEEQQFFLDSAGPIYDLVQKREALSRYDLGMSPVRWLKERNLLGPDLLAVHLVQASEEDIQDLATSKTEVVHCPRSNLKLAEGIAPILPMLEAQVSLSLGCDSLASVGTLDYFEEMRSFLLTQRGRYRRVGCLTGKTAFAMATTGGAQALGLGGRVGRLAPGFAADLMLVGCDAPSADSCASVVDTLVHCGTPSGVECTVVDGSVVWDVTSGGASS